MSKYINPGTRRIMDRVWLRDGEVIHYGEAVVLACLLHTRRSSKRDKRDLEEIQRMLNDPNLEESNEKRRGRKN